MSSLYSLTTRTSQARSARCRIQAPDLGFKSWPSMSLQTKCGLKLKSSRFEFTSADLGSRHDRVAADSGLANDVGLGFRAFGLQRG